MSQLETLLHHLLVDHNFRIFASNERAGFPGTLSHTHPPEGLAEAGFETKKYVCVEMSLMRDGPRKYGHLAL